MVPSVVPMYVATEYIPV